MNGKAALNLAMGLSRALSRMAKEGAKMTPEGCARLVTGIIAALVAVHIVEAAISSPPPRPEKTIEKPVNPPRQTPEPGDDCVVMPDGVRVCDSAPAGFEAGASKGQETIELEGAYGFLDRWLLPHAINVRDPSPLALRAVSWIVDAVGLVPNFEVVEADITREFAAYAIFRGGKRYIVYDRKSLTWDISNPNWIDVTVMAHEIGHHLNGHTLGLGASRYAKELEADRFAGFAVSRLGGSLENALAAFRGVSVEGTKTHPPRAQQLEAIEAGWRHSEALKKQEPVTCATGWLAKSFDLRGQTCRMAKVCRGKTPGYRLACEQDGRWLWTNRSAE